LVCPENLENSKIRNSHAKSLLSIMKLGVRKDKEVTLVADGSNENEDLEAITEIIKQAQ
jgi:phosphotransferase system HPr (HPr) family protein